MSKFENRVLPFFLVVVLGFLGPFEDEDDDEDEEDSVSTPFSDGAKIPPFCPQIDKPPRIWFTPFVAA